MRTQTREKLRRRHKIFPAVRGPGWDDCDEFLPVDASNPSAPYGKVFRRAEWGALPPKRSDGRLTLPVMYINTVNVFMEGEDGHFATGVKGAEAVRWFQQEDMAQGMSDIRSNFIIDEDGQIYEGRGWEQKPAITKPDHPTRYMEYLEICYIGDFTKEPINHPAHYATVRLLEKGKQKRLISRDALVLSPQGEFYPRKQPTKFLPTINI